MAARYLWWAARGRLSPTMSVRRRSKSNFVTSPNSSLKKCMENMRHFSIFFPLTAQQLSQYAPKQVTVTVTWDTLDEAAAIRAKHTTNLLRFKLISAKICDSLWQ